MMNKKQTTESQLNKQKQSTAKSSDFAELNSDTALENRFNLRNNPSISAIQRQTIAAQIGKVQGNRHLQRVIAAVNSHSSNKLIQRTPTATNIELEASVGRAGTNKSTDVRKVQERLLALRYLTQEQYNDEAPSNNATQNVPETNLTATIAAIKAFQREAAYINRPDGLIGTGGKTNRFLNARQEPIENTYRRIAFSITGIYEGKPDSYQNWDSGIVTYGKHQATISSGSLYKILKRYTELSSGEVARELTTGGNQSFLKRVQRKDATLRDNQRLKKLLKQAAYEPEMLRAQDEVFTKGYWGPAKATAQQAGVISPLGHAILYDTRIHGRGGDLGAARRQLGGNIGDVVRGHRITEQEFLLAFLRNRQRRLQISGQRKVNQATSLRQQAGNAQTAAAIELRKQADVKEKEGNANIASTRRRIQPLIDLVQSGDLDLRGDNSGQIRIGGVNIVGLRPGAAID